VLEFSSTVLSALSPYDHEHANINVNRKTCWCTQRQKYITSVCV